MKQLLERYKNWRKQKQLQKLVIAEATRLRINATQEEKNNLNFDKLTPNWAYSCIYGQMTGSCFNERATALIVESCEQVFNDNGGINVNPTLNGSPINKPRREYWSPIEVFIYNNRNSSKTENNKRLIEYIKGNTDTLKFI